MADIKNSDLDDIEMCRVINDRIMTVRCGPRPATLGAGRRSSRPPLTLTLTLQVERDLLSPYVSPRESPFRHILLGSGPHTLQALSNHLNSFRSNSPEADADLFRNQFALATWTIQGCANSLAGNIWSLYNQI